MEEACPVSGPRGGAVRWWKPVLLGVPGVEGSLSC